MSKIGAYWEILRPLNSIMLGISIIVGALITGSTSIMDNAFELANAFISGFCLTGASMTINDYFDLEIDKVNEPDRPLPSGRMESKEAVSLTIGLSLIGFITSYLVSLTALGLSVFAWLIMIIYSMWGKRTGFLGNIMVSTCIGLPFIYGGIISRNVGVALYFCLQAFLSNVGREVTKGIVDVKGDWSSGVNTIAVSLGEGVAAKIAALFYIAAIGSSVLPILKELVSIWYIPFIGITDLGFLHGAYCLVNNYDRDTARVVKNRVLYLMLIGLMGFAAGRLF